MRHALDHRKVPAVFLPFREPRPLRRPRTAGPTRTARRRRITLLLVIVATAALTAGVRLPAAFAATPNPVPGDPLTGSGNVTRTLVTYADLTTNETPAAPVDDSAFGLPSAAAMPTSTFEGTLTLLNTATTGSFKNVSGCSGTSCGHYLPTVSVSFVQNGSWLIPAVQGLVITGDPYYNYIAGPGRAWTENSDNGWTRASFPFTLVDRNQNCTHQGEMMFLFNSTTVSYVRYQITHETCQLHQFDMWGQLTASYAPGTVANDLALENAQAAEVANQMPVKPLSALATDYPYANLNLSVFGGGITASAMSAYGVVYNGVNYVADASSPNKGCQTRYGTYPFCAELRMPSYSTAKSAFANLALERLAQVYGPGVTSLDLKSYVPEMAASSNWNSAVVTFQDAANMATGNYHSQAFESDENGSVTTNFLGAEPYGTATTGKMGYALSYPHHGGEQGYTWVYHTVDQFLLAQAETGYLQSRLGSNADVFNMLRDGVYAPIHLNAGTMTTERTDNAAAAGVNPTTGRPFGAYGLFWTVDDIAKLAALFQGNGAYGGSQLVSRNLMLAGMQRLSSDAGVAAVSADGTQNADGTVSAGGYRYSNGLWAYPTTSQVPGCALRVPFMSGYGGITIAMMPNGATYYYVSDAGQFSWAAAIAELNKLAPMCAPTTTTVTASANPVPAGQPVTFTATVASASRAWAPTGTVQFADNGTAISGHLLLDANGQATFTTTLAAGSHSITAAYSPDLTNNTGISSSPARTTLTASCGTAATACRVTSTAGMRVGDTIVMGTPTLTDDSHMITALTSTSISWIGAFQNTSHGSGQPVWIQDTAGGGFTASTSPGFTETAS